VNYAYYRISISNTIQTNQGISKHLLQVKNENLRITVALVFDLNFLATGCASEGAISFAELKTTIQLDFGTLGSFDIVPVGVIRTG
jgi:hypothetical protein